MPRPPKKINPIRIKRLKQVLEQQHLTQSELARRIPISQQVMSRMMNGEATITENTIRGIAREFPEYSFAYLMGFDDMPNEEYRQSFNNAMKFRDRLMDEGYNREIVATLLKMIDIESRYEKASISIDEPWKYERMHKEGLISDEEWEGWTHGGNQSEHMKSLSAEHSDYIVTINGESFNIPVRDFFLLADDVEQYGLFRLREYVKNKKRRYY